MTKTATKDQREQIYVSQEDAVMWQYLVTQADKYNQPTANMVSYILEHYWMRGAYQRVERISQTIGDETYTGFAFPDGTDLDAIAQEINHFVSAQKKSERKGKRPNREIKPKGRIVQIYKSEDSRAFWDEINEKYVPMRGGNLSATVLEAVKFYWLVGNHQRAIEYRLEFAGTPVLVYVARQLDVGFAYKSEALDALANAKEPPTEITRMFED